MKKILALVLILNFSQSFAGIGGSSGGKSKEASGRYVIAKVCDGGESGTICREVRLEIPTAGENTPNEGPKSPKVKCMMSTGEAGLEVPCPKALENPGWLIELNQTIDSAQ